MIENLDELVPATQARSTADSAEHDIQIKVVAHAINSAANTGCTETRINQRLLPEVKTQLESLGYKTYAVGKASPETQWLIVWKD